MIVEQVREIHEKGKPVNWEILSSESKSFGHESLHRPESIQIKVFKSPKKKSLVGFKKMTPLKAEQTIDA